MSGSWSNTFQTIIVLPTGATSGARVIIDGTNDRILVYDQNGALVESVAASAGADDAGNAYVQGFGSYAPDAARAYTQLTNGGVAFGVLTDPSVTPGAAFFSDNGGGVYELFLGSPHGAGTAMSVLSLLSESAPGAGDAAIQANTDSFQFTGGQVVIQGNVQGWGPVGFNGIQTNTTGATTTELSAFHTDVTFQNGRAYAVTTKGLVSSTVAGDVVRVRVHKASNSGTTYLDTMEGLHIVSAGDNVPYEVTAVLANTTGAAIATNLSTTYVRNSGSGSVTIQAGVNNAAYTRVTDIGQASDFPEAQAIT